MPLRHPTPLRRLAPRLTAMLVLAAAGAVQAASLSLASGSAGGSLSAQAGVNGQADAIQGDVIDASGSGFVLALGSGAASLVLNPAGSLRHDWSASTGLDASAALVSFQAGSASVRQADADGTFDGAFELFSTVLDAELTVVSGAEAAGTPVRLDISGSAQSVFGASAQTLVTVVPQFDLVLRDSQGRLLGSWQGLAAGAAADFRFSVFSAVGETLQFSLSQGHAMLAGPGSLGAGSLLAVDNTALLDGQISVAVVPEPQTYALFAAGLAALLLMRARRSR